jgi:hypothetical protein
MTHSRWDTVFCIVFTAVVFAVVLHSLVAAVLTALALPSPVDVSLVSLFRFATFSVACKGYNRRQSAKRSRNRRYWIS